MKFQLKALIMVLITTVATAVIDANGAVHFPHGIGWAVLGVSLIGTGIVHTIQSFALPTTSIPGQFDLRDLLKGALIGVGNYLSLFAASYLPGATINWQSMLESAVGVFIMYIIKQVATQPKS